MNWHAHCDHVGVNVVCIDAVYKCCIKKKNLSLLKGTSTYHSSDLIYQLQKVFLFFFPEQALQLRCSEQNKNTNGKSSCFLINTMTRTCIIIYNLHGDLRSQSLDSPAICSTQIQRGQRLPGEQGQEGAQVKCTGKQVRHFHQYVYTTSADIC